MREVTLKLMIAIAVCGLAFTTAHAVALRTVEVSAPNINCLFDPTCRVTVSDTTSAIPIAAGGTNFLQSRTFRGRPGSAGHGLYVYEYRIDLRRATGLANIPCLSSFSVDFGPVVSTLDLDDNGKAGDEVFVVTRGGLGSVGLASADQSGNTITFNFSSPVCAGGHPGDGQSTFFFGVVSSAAPGRTTGSVLESNGTSHEVQVRAPQERGRLPRERGIGVKVDGPLTVAKPGGTPDTQEAVVERLAPRPCVDRGGRVTIFGSGFGSPQGSRLVELGGHGIGVLLRVRSWSNTRITAIVPDNPRIEYGQWYYIGLQDQDRHWISNISRTINICRQLQ